MPNGPLLDAMCWQFMNCGVREIDGERIPDRANPLVFSRRAGHSDFRN
jgi:hypothetical protein